MQQWIRFFIGTPQRFLGTLGGLTVMFGLFFPRVVGSAVHDLIAALMEAIAPFVQPLLTLGVICLGLGILLRAVFRRGR